MVAEVRPDLRHFFCAHDRHRGIFNNYLRPN
jgi:hypothetical protein